MKPRFLFILAALALLPRPGEADPAPAPTGWQTSVIFTEYSPYSRDVEVLRRFSTPLTALHGQQMQKQTGITVREQDIDLSRERFTLYVPDEAPPQGYGLLAFVLPWADGDVPRRWKMGLDRHGMILVTAANSENATSVIERRIPLALLGAYNVMKRYKVDPARVYIGGLSGGSRVAQSVALAYPDLFRGALLEAGSDPLIKHFPVPAADLFRRFQESMRIVFFTGERDELNRGTDAISRQTMRDWCVFDTYVQMIPEAGHVPADARSFDEALSELERHEPADPERFDSCRAKIDAEMNAELAQVETLIAGGKTDDARALLRTIDDHYGGLAAPRSIALAEKLDRPR